MISGTSRSSALSDKDLTILSAEKTARSDLEKTALQRQIQATDKQIDQLVGTKGGRKGDERGTKGDNPHIMKPTKPGTTRRPDWSSGC
jgi:hypothetical protein